MPSVPQGASFAPLPNPHQQWWRMPPELCGRWAPSTTCVLWQPSSSWVHLSSLHSPGLGPVRQISRSLLMISVLTAARWTLSNQSNLSKCHERTGAESSQHGTNPLAVTALVGPLGAD